VVLATVVVGRATVEAENDAPQVIARPVPLSVSQNCRKSPVEGVPLKFVVIEVIAVARPVNIWMSTLSVFVVGVAPGALVVAVRFFRKSFFVAFSVAGVPLGSVTMGISTVLAGAVFAPSSVILKLLIVYSVYLIIITC